MTHQKALRISLFLLRISVFLVMLIWTIDKFVRPEHASLVFQTFYFLPAFGKGVSCFIGAVELVIILGFLFGIKKKLSYGTVFVLHFISTLSCFKQYLTPYQDVYILFFAAWPMLAACFALFVLRDQDTLFSVPGTRGTGEG